MKIRIWVAAVAVLAAMLLASCGGGDDDDKSADASGGTGDNTANATTGTSGESTAKISTSTGSDAKFVGDICKAYKNFSDELTKAQANIANVKSQEDAAKLFGDPFKNLAAAFAKASPPKDLKDWHTAAAKQLNDMANSMAKGDMTAMENFATLPDPPQAALDRLTKAAEKNQDCKDANFDFNQ
jgi:hypothetical protein